MVLIRLLYFCRVNCLFYVIYIFRKPCILFLDSIKSTGRPAYQYVAPVRALLQRYCADVNIEYKGIWTGGNLKVWQPPVQQQREKPLTECGVYMLKFIESMLEVCNKLLFSINKQFLLIYNIV